MAEVIELSNYRTGELEQIKLGPLTIQNPVKKIRVHFNLLPDITIDMDKPGRGIASMIQPKATVLLSSGDAILIDPYGKQKVSKTDPSIFNTPTLMDSILSIGIIPFAILTVGTGYLIYKMLSKK